MNRLTKAAVVASGENVTAGLMALRRALYALGIFKTHRIQVPVIVIGNPTLTQRYTLALQHLQSARQWMRWHQ